MPDENIILRDKGYNDGYNDLEPAHTESEPYMDGYRLGACVLEGELENGKYGRYSQD